MLYPQVRDRYIAALESVSIPPASEQQAASMRKDSTLLCAFVTANVIQNFGFQTAVSNMKQDKSKRCFYPGFAGDPMAGSNSFSSLFSVDFLTFLRHVTPSLAADPEAFLALCSQYHMDDIRDQGHHLISINLLAYQLEQKQFFARLHGADGGDVLDHVYRFYCTQTCANMALLRRDFFEEFPLYHTSAGDRFWPAAFCAAMVFHEALKACLSRFTPSLLIFVARCKCYKSCFGFYRI